MNEDNKQKDQDSIQIPDPEQATQKPQVDLINEIKKGGEKSNDNSKEK